MSVKVTYEYTCDGCNRSICGYAMPRADKPPLGMTVQVFVCGEPSVDRHYCVDCFLPIAKALGLDKEQLRSGPYTTYSTGEPDPTLADPSRPFPSVKS